MGACPHCTGVVWGETGDDHGVCSNCQARVDRREVADRLLARIRTNDRWMNAAEYRDRLAAEGIRIPASTIRGWAHRGLAHARSDGCMPVGRLVELTRRRSQAARKQSR